MYGNYQMEEGKLYRFKIDFRFNIINFKIQETLTIKTENWNCGN